MGVRGELDELGLPTGGVGCDAGVRGVTEE